MFLRTVLAVIVGTVVLIFAASACRADDEKSVAEAIRKAGGTVKVLFAVPGEAPLVDTRELSDAVVQRVALDPAAL